MVELDKGRVKSDQVRNDRVRYGQVRTDQLLFRPILLSLLTLTNDFWNYSYFYKSYLNAVNFYRSIQIFHSKPSFLYIKF